MQREPNQPAAWPLRLPDCDDPKNCQCLRDCNLFRPPADFVRPVAADATPRERLEASTWFPLLADSTVAAYRGREDLLLPRPTPIDRIGIDPPQYPCQQREPTLDEIAAIDDLVDRAFAIAVNPQYRPCEPWRMLVTSVKDTFPFGFAVQSYLSPLPEPGPKIYPWWYRPYRRYVPPPWLSYCPNLFDGFAEGPDPDCLRMASTMKKLKEKKKKKKKIVNPDAHLLITPYFNGGAVVPPNDDIDED